MAKAPLAGTNPGLPSMIQGFNRLNFGQIPGYVQTAQEDWKKRYGEATGKGGDTAAAVGLAMLGQSPQDAYLQSLFRREESDLARQARKEDIAALIEEKRVFDQEKAKREFQYGMLAGIPQTISQSFGNISAMNLAAGQGIADTYARTLAAYPRPQFATANFQSQKYFE